MAKIIVLEGLDGSGKGTQTDLLVKYLKDSGRKTVKIDFPDYASEGSALVRLYLNGGLGASPKDTNAYAASMFYAADRYVSYVRDWKKDCEDENTVIVANRYTTANAYFQLSKLDESEYDSFLDWLTDFEYVKLGLPSPDMVMLLDMPVSVSQKLVDVRGAKKDIHETDSDYLSSCRKAAMYVAEKQKWTIVRCADDNAASPYTREKIHADIVSLVENFLAKA